MTLLDFMTRTDGSRAVYLWRAWFAVMIGTMGGAVLTTLIFPADAAEAGARPPPGLVEFAILWPAISTLMLWGILEVTRRVTPTYWHAAGAAMGVFGVLFTLAAGLDGALIFAWGYLLYAVCFLAWQLRSTIDGFVMTYMLQASVHLTFSLFVFPEAA